MNVTTVQTRRARLTRCLAEFVVEVEQIAGRLLEDQLVLRLSFEDQYKLYQLQIWSWQHKVSVELIVNELLTFWSARMPKKFKRQRGRLGVRVATLTSAKSKEFLNVRLDELYPQHENEHEWRVAQVMAIVPSSGDREFRVSDPKHFMRQYSARVLETRHRIQTAKRKYGRMPYRDNPFR